jgi:guanylate kinase
MLILLFGTSCVGKSKLIEDLANEHSFEYVNCYTTRPNRNHDKGRISISKETFIEKQEKGDFILVNNHFDALYGTPKCEILDAISSDKHFIIDFLIKDLYSFDNYTCLKIVVIPKDNDQLIQQIKMSGRENRMDEILSDYHTNFNEKCIERYKNEGIIVFSNYFCKTIENSRELFKIITNHRKI